MTINIQNILEGKREEVRNKINVEILTKALVYIGDEFYLEKFEDLKSFRDLLIIILEKYNFEEKERIPLVSFLNKLKILINNINYNTPFDNKKEINSLDRLRTNFLLA